MSEALFEPQAHADQRLALTIVIAMAVHVMVVLGVRLPTEAPIKSRFAAMEVVLMPAPAARSDGATGASAATPLTATVEPATLLVPPVERAQVKTLPVPKPTPITPAAPKVTPPAAPATPASMKQTAAPPPATPLVPSATQLFERSMAIAATGAGLIEDKTVSGQSLSERTHYIKNNTRDFAEITYKDEVRNKILRFGGLFQRPVPAGIVTIDIAIGVDGSLLDATIIKSSGVAATDEEAMRIVKLIAPFAPMSPEQAKKYDVLHMDQPIRIDPSDTGYSHGQ